MRGCRDVGRTGCRCIEPGSVGPADTETSLARLAPPGRRAVLAARMAAIFGASDDAGRHAIEREHLQRHPRREVADELRRELEALRCTAAPEEVEAFEGRYAGWL